MDYMYYIILLTHTHTHTHTPVYGVELTTLVKMQCTKIPVVMKSCIEEIEERGKG